MRSANIAVFTTGSNSEGPTESESPREKQAISRILIPHRTHILGLTPLPPSIPSCLSSLLPSPPLLCPTSLSSIEGDD